MGADIYLLLKIWVMSKNIFFNKLTVKQ